MSDRADLRRGVEDPGSGAPALPAATRDLTQARSDLRTHGLCVIADALDAVTLARAHEALYRAAADDRQRGREVTGFGLDRDGLNQRVWQLLSRDPVFCDLAEHPLAVDLVRDRLGWPALLSNISGNITSPGAGQGALHADQIFVPEPWPAEPQGLNVIWCIDGFLEANGGTEVLPGSHHWNRLPRPDEHTMPMRPVEAAAGSAVVFESRVWHRTGANRTLDARRAGIFAFYTTPIYRTQENWFLSLDPAVPRFASPTLKELLGYRSAGLGLVYGASPDPA